MSVCHDIPKAEWQGAGNAAKWQDAENAAYGQGSAAGPAVPADPSFVDLAPYLDGSAKQEVPDVAQAWAGRCLFYAGRLNEAHGAPGHGKTNALMAACNEVLNDGGNVLYIDPEDTPRGFATRMLMLGGDPAAIRDRVFYLHNPAPEEILVAQTWAKAHKPTIVVLDGLAESMAAVGANEDKAQDVLSYFRTYLRPFAENGAAVVVADHVTKNKETRGQFSRGSGAKMGRYDGVSYEIVPAVSYTPTKAGFVKLRIAKDRNGGAGPGGAVVAELHFEPGGDGRTVVGFRQPEQQAEGEAFRPTVIMDRIRKHLDFSITATKTELRRTGKAEYVDKALAIMIEDGELSLVTKGQSHIYSLKKKAS